MGAPLPYGNETHCAAELLSLRALILAQRALKLLPRQKLQTMLLAH